MASSNWSRVRQLVEEALELPHADRARWLDSACGDDTALRAEVDGLLAAEQHVDQLGESPFAGVIASVVPAFGAQPTIGARIGAYELVGVIASGGMGTVYEALQRSPQRKVALKVMRESLTTVAERSRFRFEAEVLARLQHPNIAQVYESGVQVEGERGQRRETPYFAMEFVEGHRTLLEYADEHGLDVAARARLFLQVCDAVHHGHQKGVIHRDIKPNNVLVTSAGQVKVIDFGVARAIEHTEAARTLQTQSGQLIGTLSYMSPEQFGADPNAIDVRSDVYALGTVLYELLAGSLPFALETKAVHEIARIVTLERPRRPRSLQPALPVALEWILLKTLEKEPALRYASASELALDIERFLDHKPVLAGAPSVLHRMQLAIRRNRLASSIATLAALAIVGTTVIYLRSVNAARAKETQRLYSAMISAADAALRVNDVAGAQTFLERAPAQRRDWEWHHLEARRDESVGTWREKGANALFRPRLNTLTSVTDNTVLEWNNGPEHSPRTLLAIEGDWAMSAWAWFSDGARLALAAQDGAVRVYSIDDAVALQASANVRGHVSCVSFSPDGMLLVAAVENGTVCVLDARSGAQLATLQGHRAGVMQALFDTSGTRIFSSAADTTVRVWDWRAGTGRVLAQFGDDVGALVLSADGRTLVAGSHDQSFRIFDAESGTELQRVAGLASGVSALALTHASNLIVCGLGGGQIEVFDLSSATRVRTLMGHGRQVISVAMSADDSTIATVAFDGALKLWDLRVPACAAKVHAHWGDTSELSFDERGRWLVTTGWRDGLVCVWDAPTGRLQRVLPDHPGAVSSAAFSSGGERLVTCDDRGGVMVWSTHDFARVWTMPAVGPPEDNHHRARFDGSQLVVCDAKGRLERWSVGAATPDEALDQARDANRWLSLELDHGRLGRGTDDGRVMLLRSTNFERIWCEQAHSASVTALSFSPDGASLASVGNSNALAVQDALTGRVLKRILVPGERVDTCLVSVDYSPDGSRLVVGSMSGFVRLFDAHSLELILSFNCNSWVRASFTPDGSALAATTALGELFVWRSGRDLARVAVHDLEPSLVARAQSVFASMRAERAQLDDVLADITAAQEFEPALKEAVLERAHRERATKGELLHRAMQILVANEPDVQRRKQAANRARALRRAENADPEAMLASAFARLRDPWPDGEQRWESVVDGFERAKSAAAERGDRVWSAACAGEAIALVHLGRSEEAREQLALARACPRFEPEWSALLLEADALLASEPAATAGQPVR